MSDSADDLDQVSGFVSYHRPDNRDYIQVVDQLKSELSGRFEASTGRKLSLFLDRDSIGWGEDWRERIRESVLSTTFFIPIVTMRYFRSDACREELNTYYENARQLGVTELIMPVVLAGAAEISATHPNPDVRLIERLNYIPIEAEWEAGYASPEWRRVVNRMVRELSSALSKSETELDTRARSSEQLTADEPEPEVDLGALTKSIESTTREMMDTMAVMNRLGSFLNEVVSELPDDATELQRQAAWLKSADEIGRLSNQFAEAAGNLERRTTETDAMLRAVVTELRDIDNQQSREALDTLASSASELRSMRENISSIDQAVEGLRMASMMNVSLRKALQPAIRGMQSMRIVMSTASTWGDL